MLSGGADQTVISNFNIGYVHTGPFPNGSGPKIGPHRSKNGPAVLQVQFWVRSAPGPESSRLNTWIGSKKFHVNGSRSGLVPCKHRLNGSFWKYAGLACFGSMSAYHTIVR